MKKYLLALLFMPLFFCQCNPDENDTEQEGIHLSGRAYATGAKTEMTNQNGEGIISWSSEKTEKIFSYAINTQNTFVEFVNNGNGGDKFTSAGNVISAVGQYIRFYRIGESLLNVIKTDEIGFPLETEINISIAEQTGNIDDFSKYHISKSNDVVITRNQISSRPPVYEYTFGDATFTSMIAYANFDLSKYSDKEVVISVEGANNHFCFKSAYSDNPNSVNPPSEIFSQVDDTNGAITITNPSENTYVAFLPCASSTLNFSVDGENIGSVTFPTDGIVANCFYAGPNGNPIKIGGRVIVK